jgi:cell division protein FtsQ
MKNGKSDKVKIKNSLERRRKLAAFVLKLKTLVIAAVTVTGAAAAIYFFPQAVPSVFSMQRIELAGNEHLTDDELMQIAGLKGKKSSLLLSSRKVYEKLKESPWIQSAAIRKEYPSRLLIRIRETEPFALLNMKGKMFIVDDKGRMLEQLKENSVPFLPVILSDPYREKDAYREAVDLAKTIKDMGILHRSQRIEIIAHQPNEIAANLDGMIVKIGTGEHEDKLARLLEIEQEIRKRNIPVAYIDLRFARKVVVKPVNEVIR